MNTQEQVNSLIETTTAFIQKTLPECLLSESSEGLLPIVGSTLKHIHFPAGYTLVLKKEYDTTTELGKTDFLLTSPDGKEYYGDAIAPLLKVDLSADGIWEYFLFANSKRYLPVEWHGAYLQWKLLLNAKEIDYIPALAKYDQDKFKKNVVDPEVFFKNGFAFIKYNYWSEWEGLVRETDRLRIVDGSIVDYSYDLKEIVVHYSCGYV